MRLERYDESLDLYDEAIEAPDSEYQLDLTDRASLLMRLELDGVDVGGRWARLAESTERRVDEGLSVFCDAHWALIDARVKQKDVRAAIDTHLEPHWADLKRIGGSYAQRDVFVQLRDAQK